MRRAFVRLALAAAALCSAASPTFAQSAASHYTYATRYDAAGRVTGTIAPDPDVTSTDGPFAAVRNTYDLGGRLIKVETGQLTAWQSESIAPANWTGFNVRTTLDTDYDTLSHKVKDTLSGGGKVTVTQYSYDTRGRLDCTAVRMNTAVYGSLPASACTASTQGTDGPDRITHNVYDAADRLTKVQKAYGTPIEADYATYAYTANGKQEFVTDANGNKAKFVYDGHDRQIAWLFPSKTTAGQLAACTIGTVTEDGSGIAGPSTTRGQNDDCEKYWHDRNGNRAKLQKRDGSLLTYAYDKLDRMTVKTVPERTGLDPVHSRDVYYAYDAMGRQTRARFDSLSGEGVTNTYNGFGELKSWQAVNDGFSRTMTARFDLNGNRSQVIIPNATLNYAYDGLDRLETLSLGTTLLDAFEYGDNGLVSRRSEGTGASSVNYGWDGIDRLECQADHFAGSSAASCVYPSGTGNVAWTFARNAASQITSETRSNDAYAWTGAAPGNVAYAVNGLNQYTNVAGAALAYDANGNLVTDPTTAGGTTSYTYDIENRLVEAVRGNVTVTLTYDPLGRLARVVKTTGTTTDSDTRMYYDGDAMVIEYDASNVALNRYAHGSNASADDPLVWFAGAGLTQKKWLHADRLGSIVAATDASGANPTINSYDEYGIPASGNTGRFQYTGQVWLSELGLYYYKARLYSPTLGRFLQTDPIGYEGGINLYGYVGNDPVNEVDFDGKSIKQKCYNLILLFVCIISNEPPPQRLHPPRRPAPIERSAPPPAPPRPKGLKVTPWEPTPPNPPQQLPRFKPQPLPEPPQPQPLPEPPKPQPLPEPPKPQPLPEPPKLPPPPKPKSLNPSPPRPPWE